jgi:DNA-binding winged helix-turn-helix (wHTH) protein
METGHLIAPAYLTCLPCFQEEGTFMRMEKCSFFPSTTVQEDSPTSFVLPGVLPAETWLLLDAEAHTVTLLTLQGAERIPTFRSFQLTPSATTIFLTLLQAYPQSCSYQSLFDSLYPQQANREQVWEKSLAVPPVRRALKALLPMLRSFRLRVISLRGHGYVLAAMTNQTASQEQEHIHPKQQREGEQA